MISLFRRALGLSDTPNADPTPSTPRQATDMRLGTTYTPGDLFFEILKERDLATEQRSLSGEIFTCDLPNHDKVETRQMLISGLGQAIALPLAEAVLKQLDRVWEPDYLGVLIEKDVAGKRVLTQHSIVDHGLLASVALKYPDMMEINLILTTTAENCGGAAFIRQSTYDAINAVNATMAEVDKIPPFKRIAISINDPRFGEWNDSFVSSFAGEKLQRENSLLVQACALGLIDIIQVPARLHPKVRELHNLIKEKRAEEPVRIARLEAAVTLQLADRNRKITEGCDACTLKFLEAVRGRPLGNNSSTTH